MPSNHRKALVTGVTGQDGSYLAELLLSKGYEVHAIVRRASSFNRSRIEHLNLDVHSNSKLLLYYGDLADSTQISNMIRTVRPDEIYHLGAQSHVGVSFELPEYTSDVTGLGTTRILEAVRQSQYPTRFYFAGSSEMFGATPPPQSESSPFRPRSPYACSKVYAYWMTKNYREGFNMWCCTGILFNHESPRRGPTFVTRKIAAGVAAILAKKQDHIYLGNLDSKRDWGYAPEYVEVMWELLQQKKPSDFVVGTGENHSVRELLDEAFAYVGLKPDAFVKHDERYLRPTEPSDLKADSSAARRELRWEPRVKFDQLVKILVDAEMKAIGLDPIGEGQKALDTAFPVRWWNDDAYISFSSRVGLR